MVDPNRDEIKQMRTSNNKVPAKRTSVVAPAQDSTVSEVFEHTKSKYGSRWNSLIKENAIGISFQDWVTGLDGKACTTIFSHTLGRFSSMIHPKELSALPMQRVGLLVVLDMANNEKSHRRQMVLENSTTLADKELEHHIPALLTLSGAFFIWLHMVHYYLVYILSHVLLGVQCVVVSNWSTSIASQKKFVSSFFDAFVADKCSVAEALRVSNGGQREVVSSSMASSAPGASISRKSSVSTSSKTSKKSVSASKSSEVVVLLPAGTTTGTMASSPPSPALRGWAYYSRSCYGIGHHLTYSATD